MKKIIFVFMTLLILILSNLLLSNFLKTSFLELSFMTGFMFTILIAFFSSEGGIFTRLTDMGIGNLLDKESNQKNYFTKFYISTSLIVSICYTIISVIISIISYWKYF